LFWSPLQVLITVAFGTLLAVIIFRLYEPSRALLNTIFWAYPAALASLVARMVSRGIIDPLVSLGAAVFIILVVYLATNFAATSLYRHLLRGEPFWRYWWRTFTENPLSQLLAAPVPILLGAVAQGFGERPQVLLLLTAISAVTMPAGRAQLAIFLASQRTVRDIVRALMIALERVVPGAQAHAERVSDLVGETGQLLRVSANTLESWRTAGLLHDIGLIDAASRRGSQVSHAIVGARILDSYPDSVVADMVREHHTPWSALPPRLRSSVALGARVLAAAEVYDELRYGTATVVVLNTHEATALALRPLIGKQLDPRITAVFLDAAERRDTKRES
jgi:putative nucleotidyltransferase with HDIG domain